MVVQNEIMNAASKQYSMNYVTKADIVQKYTQENNTDTSTDVAASVSISQKADNGVSAYTGIIDKAQESITKNQVADMSLAEMNKKLYRITQLSIQAGYEGKSYNDKREIQDIGANTNFNGEKVFVSNGNEGSSNENLAIDGTNNIDSIDGIGNSDSMVVKTDVVDTAGTYTNVNNIPKISIDYTSVLDTIDEIDVTKPQGSDEALVQTNKAMDYIDDARKYIQNEQTRLEQLIQGAVGVI